MCSWWFKLVFCCVNEDYTLYRHYDAVVWRHHLQCRYSEDRVILKCCLSTLLTVRWDVHILLTVPYSWLYLVNVWQFVYFVWGLSPPKCRVVRWRNFASRHVQTMCRTSAGFYVYTGRRYKNDIFQKITGMLCRCTSAIQSFTKSCCSRPTGRNSWF